MMVSGVTGVNLSLAAVGQVNTHAKTHTETSHFKVFADSINSMETSNRYLLSLRGPELLWFKRYGSDLN